jgi:hypothetical protein
MICTAPLQYNHITRQGQYYIKADLLHKNWKTFKNDCNQWRE